jgi:hypothetical protein
MKATLNGQASSLSECSSTAATGGRSSGKLVRLGYLEEAMRGNTEFCRCKRVTAEASPEA